MANLLCLNNVATVLYVVIPVVVCNLRGETSFGNMHIRLGTTYFIGFGF